MRDVDVGTEAVLQKCVRRLRVLFVVNLLMVATGGVALVTGFTTANRTSAVQGIDSLRVRELVVLDGNGVERVRLSGRMPDAVINGRRVARPEPAAGVMLYDDLGQERGGYVTFSPSRSIGLTFDTRANQVAYLGADSAGGASIGLWQGSDRVEVRASQSSGSGLYVFKAGKLIVQQPPMSVGEEAKVCSELKQEVAQATVRFGAAPPANQVRNACELHMSGTACRKCLRTP